MQLHPAGFRLGDSIPSGYCPGPLAVVLVLAALTAVGCSSRSREPVVSGKVTVNGAPAASGSTITFLGEGGKEASTTVGADGAYTMMGPPLGPVQITVKGNAFPVASAGGEAPAGMKAAPGVAVPPKYSRPDNGLTYTVVAGKQAHDIELSP